MKNLVFITFLMISTMSYAQFVNDESKVHSVQYVKDNAIRYSFLDKSVNLQGYIVEHIGEDYYLFKDDSGQIRVEIYRSRMPSTPFTKDATVIISGEVDLFFFRPEIYVSSISIQNPNKDKSLPEPNSSTVSKKKYY